MTPADKVMKPKVDMFVIVRAITYATLFIGLLLIYVPTRTGVRWMLFDTRDDPGEEHDVAAEHPEVTARLQGELWAWMRRDPDMTERGGYLVPRDVAGGGAGRGVPDGDVGLVRLEGDGAHGGR